MAKRMSNALVREFERELQRFVGRTIVKAGYMLEADAKQLGWYSSPPMLELDDGTVLFPSRDDEGNGAGALFGITPEQDYLVYPEVR